MKTFVGRDFKSYYVKVLVPIGADNFVFLFPVELLQAQGASGERQIARGQI